MFAKNGVSRHHLGVPACKILFPLPLTPSMKRKFHVQTLLSKPTYESPLMNTLLWEKKFSCLPRTRVWGALLADDVRCRRLRAVTRDQHNAQTCQRHEVGCRDDECHDSRGRTQQAGNEMRADTRLALSWDVPASVMRVLSALPFPLHAHVCAHCIHVYSLSRMVMNCW